MPTKRELLDAEEAAWAELLEALEALTDEETTTVGYYPDWSVRDLLGHLACWAAEAARQLERMVAGTYREERLDVDAMNADFREAMRPCTLPEVRAELWASRTHLLQALDALHEVTPQAVEWFEESATAHAAEHLPRLREWTAELRAGA